MLTVLSYLVPNMKDIRHSIMVEYCVAQTKYYCRLKDPKQVLYWSSLATEYLLKRLDYVEKLKRVH